MIDMKKLSNLLSTIYAFNNTWKTDEDGNIELKDGNPVFVDGSGREMTVQGDTISRLNGEAKTHRLSKEEAEKKLQGFEGLDANEAREAIEKLKQVDLTKMVEAGEVDKIKAQVSGEYQKQLEEKDAANQSLQSKLDSMYIDNVFNSSQFARENIAVPQDMFQSFFRNNFKVENGTVRAYDKAGNALMSKDNVGEYATPDEALRLLVNAHPQKDVILRADTGSGSGSSGAGGNRGSGRAMRRSDFEKLPPNKQAEFSAKIRAGEASLVD